MPREKEYNRDEALQNAMLVFWRKGYESTSIQDIVDATGINRFGIYHEFNSKEDLFREALDRYGCMVVRRILEPIKKQPQGLISIKFIFHKLIEMFSKSEKIKGCLLVNSALDIPMMDKQTKSQIKKSLEEIEEIFQICLIEAKKMKEISPAADVTALSQYLLGIFNGVGVYARTHVDKTVIQNFINIALSSLEKN